MPNFMVVALALLGLSCDGYQAADDETPLWTEVTVSRSSPSHEVSHFHANSLNRKGNGASLTYSSA